MGCRVGDLVVEGEAGERGVVRLDVQLVLALEPVAGEEAVYDCRVVVVLVLCRFHRLRFDQERPIEADAALLVDDEMEEARQLLAFTAQVGVEQGVVTLASAQST